jgi:hypothetical protein
MRRFSNFTNEVQISPLLERDSHTHDHINLFCLWVDTTSLGIIMMVLCPLLKPIVRFQLSCTMVAKSVKVFMDMVCAILSVIPPNPTFV